MSTTTPSVIRRPDKGLTISGTRVTLYALMDYLHWGWPHDEIRDWLSLSDDQLRAALDYIAAHHDEVEAEYREVVRKAEERRRYYEELEREHLARTPPSPTTPERAALRVRIAEQRARLDAEFEREEQSRQTSGVSAEEARQ
ncbi:MAG TPA: DUF433 domain-containing protein [Ktedonobacterales bacterium]|nr:DUF433 domain-containing protein [Ktedonobacterales bacterium]